MDILEDGEEYLFRVDLPGTKAEDITIVVERDDLFISGERPEPWQANMTCLRVERPHGHFERRFALPEDASQVEIDSTMSDSVLEVRVRKVRPRLQPPAPDAPPRLRLSTVP